MKTQLKLFLLIAFVVSAMAVAAPTILQVQTDAASGAQIVQWQGEANASGAAEAITATPIIAELSEVYFQPIASNRVGELNTGTLTIDGAWPYRLPPTDYSAFTSDAIHMTDTFARIDKKFSTTSGLTSSAHVLLRVTDCLNRGGTGAAFRFNLLFLPKPSRTELLNGG